MIVTTSMTGEKAMGKSCQTAETAARGYRDAHANGGNGGATALSGSTAAFARLLDHECRLERTLRAQVVQIDR